MSELSLESVESVEFVDSSSDDRGIEIVEWLQSSTETYLDVSDVMVADELEPSICQAIASAPHVRSVRLPQRDAGAYYAVLDGAMANARITGISAEFEDDFDNDFGDDDMILGLARFVMCADGLREFSISKCSFSISPIFDALTTSWRLQSLVISRADMDEDDALVLAKALLCMPELEDLTIFWNSIGPVDFEAIFGALAGAAENLKRLDIRFNYMHGSTLTALARLLRACLCWRMFPLDGGHDSGVEDNVERLPDLARVLGGRPFISFEDFNFVSPRAGWALGRAMRNVRRFEMTNCIMIDACAEGIAFGLKNQPNDVLEIAILCLRGLTEVGWVAFAEAMADQSL